MNHNRFSLLLLLTFLCYNFCFAQQPAHVPGQILVSVQPGKSPQALTRRMERDIFVSSARAKKVADLLNVWLLETIPSAEQAALEWLRRQPEVRMAQYNHILENRGAPIHTNGFFPYENLPTENEILPNDPLFSQQWQLLNTGANGGTPNADLDAELAWDITTGGLTPAGDTIVVAVIDGGINLTNNELLPNLWKNWAEIPGDNIDNDNNGYVDDFRGWNVYVGNDNILGVSTGHGTPVSAIIGAKGNNNLGVTGINWNVKIMFVAGGGTEAKILESYNYVLQSRKRYNASNGQSGAFVVAVNCSWGTDYGQPADAPLWCAAFDSLGAAGIISVAATANNPVNVDAVGDLPTTCPSDFQLAVTSLTKTDAKAPNAAWGAQHVDLGAYGEGVFTAGSGNSYGSFTGTSFAAPQVAGAVGLLYSAPCPNLIAMAKADPAAAALWAKDLVLNSTTPNSALQGITLTGGRLNLYSLLQDYQDQCSPCPAPFALHALDISVNAALLKWSEIADFQTVTLHWRQSGASTWNTVNDVENSYFLENLQPCTWYEFALSAVCQQGISSDLSVVANFKTDGCCEPPANIWANGISSTKATLIWNKVTAAIGYRLRVRPAGGSWMFYDLDASTLFTLENLSPCTDYEAQVLTLCTTGPTTYSNPTFFKTAGCGSCTDANYCTAKAEYADEEWIASVAIGNWEHNSGGNSGYQDFTGNQASVLQIFSQTPLDVTVTPGFSGLPYKEHFRIFIDFNMDGDFNDDGELAFDPGWASDSPMYGQLAVPDFQSLGLTRMRVMMKYKGVSNLPPTPCETFEFGQVEDYCVELSLPVSAEVPGQMSSALLVYPQPASEEVTLEFPDNAATGTWNISAWDVTGRQIFSEMRSVATNGTLQLTVRDWPSGAYVVSAEQGGRMFRGVVLKG